MQLNNQSKNNTAPQAIPRTVWKYLSPETAELVLANGTIRFSPLTALNDRRDCLFDLTDEVAFIRNTYFPIIRDRSHSGSRRSNDTPERTIEKNIREQLQHSGFRILSLSLVDPTTSAAEGMWGHYSQSSLGICLEFDYSMLISGISRAIELAGYANPLETGPIIYKKTPPKYPNANLPEQEREKRTLQAIFRKDSGWSIEREYRIATLIEPKAPERSFLLSPLFTWVFPRPVLTRIHIGSSATTATISMVNKYSGGIRTVKHDILGCLE